MPSEANEASERLVVRACQGEARAFAELIRGCERVVLAVAFAALGDADLAGDVAQETFLRAWKSLAELKRPGAFEGWVCQIARNMAADWSRRRSAMGSAPLAVDESATPAESADGPRAGAEAAEERQRIAEALAELDPATRTAIVMRYYENVPSRQIGELLGLSAAAVDMRLSRGREQLRRRLRGLRGEADEQADAPADAGSEVRG